MDNLFPFPRMGRSFLDVLQDPFSRKIFGHEAGLEGDRLLFITGFTTRLDFLIRNPANHLSLFKLGYTCLEAFLQSNVTGPPLDFNPQDVLFPKPYNSFVADLSKEMFASLTVQGETIYSLTPHIELFWVAKTILSNEGLCEGFNGRRARMRVNFWHQKLLSDPNDLLRDQIYDDAEVLEGQLTSRLKFHGASAELHFVECLVEKAVIDVYYGNDLKARTYLAKAAKVRNFEFALTGALGKRTKFQDRDLSQLVVLARSGEEDIEKPYSRKGSAVDNHDQSGQSSIVSASTPEDSRVEATPPRTEAEKRSRSPAVTPAKKPENIPLNDDTLLESIHFAPPKLLPEVISNDAILPSSLSELNPSQQPLLKPFDSIILLQIASSISNTSPSDGLTREETLPYATRVLEGGSSNWQVYTQALLVRSRIEGYRSRTSERGLLQLQALVDQVIVETTIPKNASEPDVEGASVDELEINSPAPTSERKPQPRPQSPSSGLTSFLPTGRPSESAPVAERLKHIYQLHPPLRWELEAELAARWVSMGGLKTALEIYERLQMHAEVALCLAATNNEPKAIRRIRELLFQSSPNNEPDDQTSTDTELEDLPPDAPRLFCILGDLENSPKYYERAWTLSKGRYHRAQRSLGRYYVRKKNHSAAAEAYAKSLEVNRLNASTWFALGCVQLELAAFQDAVASFTRTVQLETDDAEAWSNLAAALLRLPEEKEEKEEEEEEVVVIPPSDPTAIIDEAAPSSPAPAIPLQPNHSPQTQALTALRRAAKLKHSDPRIWDNYLTVAASIPPPQTPWSDVILAQHRLIELRGKTLGERAVDAEILTVLVRYVTAEFEYPTSKAEDEDEGALARNPPARTPGHGDGDGDEQEAKHPTPTAQLEPSPFPRGHVARQLARLLDTDIAPLITTEHRLCFLLADFQLWRRRALAALQARERGWRCVVARPGVYERLGGKRGNKADELGWDDVVAATVRLVDAYRELGPRVREQGVGAGGGGKAEDAERELVAGDWRFKAKSALRGVLGKGREMWEGSEGWQRLEVLLQALSA